MTQNMQLSIITCHKFISLACAALLAAFMLALLAGKLNCSAAGHCKKHSKPASQPSDMHFVTVQSTASGF